MTMTEMIEAVQRSLGVEVDGRPGPETWRAIHAKLVQPAPGTAMGEPFVSKVDAKSEGKIATLLPEVQPYARALVQNAAATGIQIRVISGFRSYQEQDALYAKGRTAPGNIVTNAPSGFSNHNFGIAFDIGVFENGAYLGKSPKYKAVGVLGVALGLEWGGNWTTLVDEPHFQLRPGWAAQISEKDMLAELRERVGSDQPVYA